MELYTEGILVRNFGRLLNFLERPSDGIPEEILEWSSQRNSQMEFSEEFLGELLEEFSDEIPERLFEWFFWVEFPTKSTFKKLVEQSSWIFFRNADFEILEESPVGTLGEIPG